MQQVQSRVRLLGPVDVTVDGAERAVSGLRRKSVLAVLGLHVRETVSTDRIIDVVWGGHPPATAANTLQQHISHLRDVLGVRTAIVSAPPGYRLDPADGGTDVELAEELIRQGRAAADPAEAVTRLRAALALWRGRPLAEVAGQGAPSWLAEQAQRLEGLRLDAVEDLVDARLALHLRGPHQHGPGDDEHEQLVAMLQRLTSRHPVRERLHGQLMLALDRAGRRADALAAYERLRRTLAEELGIDPGTAVRRIADSMRPRTEPARPAVAQLPLAVARFAGRRQELAALDAAAAPVVLLTGTAGVGKTSLAVHWAHRAAAAYPDGQLYVNLCGFNPGGPAREPSDVLHGFLTALGDDADRIPQDLTARAGRYRSLLAGRRMLVLLDNARDTEQVRPLLPGTTGSLTVVTSRDRLAALVAGTGAQPLSLDTLDRDEARELLAARLGAERADGEPDAVAELIDRCAGLPLALAVTAARAAIRPRLPLAAVVAELRGSANTLDAFGGADALTDVRAVFSWSLRALSPAALRLFRLIGVHPGADLTVPVAASLIGLPAPAAWALLGELAGAHLLTEGAPGRYQIHDLLRSYAIEQAAVLRPAETRAALHRVLEHYLQAGVVAARLIEPQYDPITVPPSLEGVSDAVPGDIEAALAWFDVEHGTVLAAIRCADDAGFDSHVWQLAWTLGTYLQRRGFTRLQEPALHIALAAARRLEDPEGEGHIQQVLGMMHARAGQMTRAQVCFERSYALFEQLDDKINMATLALRSSWVIESAGDYEGALRKSEQAAELLQGLHHPLRGRALNSIGWCHAQLGDHLRAVAFCELALTLIQRVGEPYWEAATWDSLGFAYRGLGELDRSIECYERSVALMRRLADRYSEAEALIDLGDTYRMAGDLDKARQLWAAGLVIYEDLEHPNVGTTRERLTLWAAPAGT